MSNPTEWGRRGRDRMVVGYTTTYAANAYHLRQVDGFLGILRFPPQKPPRYN